CRSDAKIEDRLLAQVEHTVKRVLRWREQASFAPLERALRPVLLPDLGGAPPLQNKRELLVQVVLDVERFSRRDLAHEHAALGLKRPGQLHERAQSRASARPGLPRKRGEVGNAGHGKMNRYA